MRASADSGDFADAEFQKHVQKSQQALRTLHQRVVGTWLVLAVVTAVFYEAHYFLAYDWHTVVDDVPFATHLLVKSFFDARLLLLTLAPFAKDVLLMRIVLLIDVLVFAIGRAVTFLEEGIGQDSWERALLVSYYVRGSVVIAVGVSALCERFPRNLQERMWFLVLVYVAPSLAETVVRAMLVLAVDGVVDGSLGGLPPNVVLLYFTCAPRLRLTLQARLRHWVDRKAALRGAASIACLIGGVRPSEAVAQATSRFRTVRPEKLSFEAFRTNTPDPSLGCMARPAILGDCDAFVSHSWHDDPEAKWNALRMWRREFRSQERHEPSIWFDRCCIDQANIDMDLRCLPIFLKGCRRLVVLCGETYLSRLWCIVEIFIYVHMGGRIEDVRVLPVLRAGSEEEDLKAILLTFTRFDVAACQCFDPEDKARLLAMIDVAYGSTAAFNAVVRGITSVVELSIRNGVCMSPVSTSTALPSEPSCSNSDAEGPC